MAGHSKWANIKRRKGAQDAKRGKIFTKLIKEITVAAKMGDPDPAANPRLRLAVDKAKAQSMPKDTIQRAIDKAVGALDGDAYENITYEGYGPAGIAVLVECLTDNRNRTSADVRHAFTKHGGNLGTSGSVAYQFARKGVFTFPKESTDEETLMMQGLEGNAEDVEDAGEIWTVTCAFEDYDLCRNALEELGIEEMTSELMQQPDNTVALSAEDAEKVQRLVDHLDDLDDVQDTWTNAEFPEDPEDEA
ncbi:MAG: YebC/PmpR family DNA-binding transcriptional regulator [Deltaproteobacteria bacterium]|nr:MAG: YebC/PmpR family DNA-binding transcriptional regulator [Deltaproteobacteria bacterium]